MASREESTGPGSKSLDPGSSLNVFPAPFALCTVSPGPPSGLPVSFHRAGESGGLLRVELDTFDEFVLNHPEIQNVRANSQFVSDPSGLREGNKLRISELFGRGDRIAKLKISVAGENDDYARFND